MQWWRSTGASEIKEIPFLSPAVINKLDKLIQPDWKILEHGSGGSTIWFAKRCAAVLAVENNADWRGQLLSRKLSGVSVVQDLPINAFNFDLMLIDGEPLEDRSYYLTNAYSLVKAGGWVVLDNANRPNFAKEREWMRANCEKYETFDGNEPGTKYLVTEFYKLKGSEQ